MTAAAPRITMLNAEDSRGGAARAAYRLHRGLRGIGVDSNVLVQRKQSQDPAVFGPAFAGLGNALNVVRAALDLAPVLLYPRRDRQTVFYPGWLSDGVNRRLSATNPDLVHLHWVTRGFVNVRSLRGFRRPLVWTLHDMWPFTGGCHYDGGCGRHQRQCGGCPVLGSEGPSDLSARGWKRKADAYRGLAMTFVAPSNWMRDVAGKSALLCDSPVHVIPNAIDTDVYCPSPRGLARQKTGLPPGKKLILFGAANVAGDPRKGMNYLEQALRILASSWKGAPIAAVIFGSPAPESRPDLGMEVLYPGIFHEDAGLANLYAAADVFAAPSLQENLSNTVMEALSCGTPCVAFDLGGMGDMIEHQRNGYLARPRDAIGLADGLRWALEDETRHAALCARAREKVVAEFESKAVATRHLALYRSILEEAGP